MTSPVQRCLPLRMSVELVILRAFRRKWMLPKVKLIVRRAQVRLFKVVLRVGLIKMLATVGPFTAKVSTLSMMHIDAETSLKESSIKQMDQRYLCFSDQNRICLLLFITANMILYVQIHDMEKSTRVFFWLLSCLVPLPVLRCLVCRANVGCAVGKGRQDNQPLPMERAAVARATKTTTNLPSVHS